MVGVGLTNSADKLETVLGKDVTVGHKAVLSGCTIEDGCLIGMSAVVQHGVPDGTWINACRRTVVPVDAILRINYGLEILLSTCEI